MTERPLIVPLDSPLVAVRAASAGSGGPDSPPGAPGQDPALTERDLQSERASLVQARAALEQGLAGIEGLRAEVIRQAEEQLLELALEIARKVLVQEIQAGRYDIDPIVREALARVPARRDVVVHLNPRDLAACRIAQEAQACPDAGSVRFVADASVPPAECRLETADGVVESNLDIHLGEIAEVLKSPE